MLQLPAREKNSRSCSRPQARAGTASAEGKQCWAPASTQPCPGWADGRQRQGRMSARGLCLASISSARLAGMVLPCPFGAVGSLLALAAPGQAAALRMGVCSGGAAGTALLTEPPGAQSPTRGFSRAEKPAAVGLLPSLLHSSMRRWIYRDLSISRSCFTEVTGPRGFTQPAAGTAQLLQPCPKTSLLVQAQRAPGSRATPGGCCTAPAVPTHPGSTELSLQPRSFSPDPPVPWGCSCRPQAQLAPGCASTAALSSSPSPAFEPAPGEAAPKKRREGERKQVQTEQTRLPPSPAANPSPMCVKHQIRPGPSAFKHCQRLSAASKGQRGDFGAFPSPGCSRAAPSALLSPYFSDQGHRGLLISAGKTKGGRGGAQRHRPHMHGGSATQQQHPASPERGQNRPQMLRSWP